MTQPLLTNNPDLQELKASLVGSPVLSTLPALTISPDDCHCHWSWIFNHPERKQSWGFSLESSIWGDEFLKIWDSLLDDVYQAPQRVLAFDDSFHDIGFLGLESLSGQQLKIWLRAQNNTESIEAEAGDIIAIYDSMVFCCGQREWISYVSNAIQDFFNDPDFQPQIRDLEPLHTLSFQATAKEWPWTLFSLWYDFREVLADWQVQWLVTLSLIEGYASSWLFAQDRELIDQVIFQYFWTCTLVEMLQRVHARCPETNMALLAPELAAFEAEREVIHEFIDTMDLAWRDHNFYGCFGDGSYFPQYYEEPYRTATAEKHLVSLKWWVLHLKYLTRRAIPGLYDWEQNLAQTQPELYARLDLKWRQNLIWRACFDKNPNPPCKPEL